MLQNLPLVVASVALLATALYLLVGPLYGRLLARVDVPDGFTPRALLLLLLAGVVTALFVAAILRPQVERWVFAPLAAVTVLLRLASPLQTYRGLRQDATPQASWPQRLLPHLFGVAALVVVAFLLVKDLGLFPSGDVEAAVTLSEQAAAALVVAFAFSRGYARLIRRRDAVTEHWRRWLAAFLVAIAFILLLPVFVPTFDVWFKVAGYGGWGLAVVWTFRTWADEGVPSEDGGMDTEGDVDEADGGRGGDAPWDDQSP